MNVPVLRKTIRLPNLARATVSVRSVVPLDKRRVDLPTARRGRQCRLDLLVRAKHCSIVDFRYSAFLTGLTDRCIDQFLRRHEKNSSRTARQARRLRDVSLAEHLQNRLFIRFIFITRYQPRRIAIQALRRFLHQQFCSFFRSPTPTRVGFRHQGRRDPSCRRNGYPQDCLRHSFFAFSERSPISRRTGLLRCSGEKSTSAS